MGITIDGKEIARKIRGEIAAEIQARIQAGMKRPKLVVVLVGEDPASQTYVRNKEKACAEVGMESEVVRLPAGTKQADLSALVKRLNADKSVDGVLVQLPLPKGLDDIALLGEIDPDKDADGIHPLNMGKLLRGEEARLAPCTPLGIMEMILSTGTDIKGKEAVVVGRSNIVGKPVAIMLLAKNATVTICHSRTSNLSEVIGRADIVVAAVGRPELVKGAMIKKGAVVIDVGMNKLDNKWVGDVEFEKAKERASYISPVPGGVGPMTIAMLLRNTLKAAEGRKA
ncbi:MAG: bifunctional methylenetetrahydrofolate dehydrogenase/methenyltetrahydrofolate cyclohydrolase FolD [Candidatus Margulisbacteria bacterium]|jgi:methylenetetrahydrofolate dehydrogenase (NADP+)/methenyltetrahydrofolate cyclohydrolase|nr:bifunctional methylenetetrahydrofolate dehydrogenase/methenyltetrahydrofolate cyclohydrolase FolD [Candidatus Margulisiibacteriota bacterium]